MKFLIFLSFCSTKIAVEAQHGLIAQVLKDVIFSMRPNSQVKVEELSQVTDMAIG
jgi:COP9 signalosome complex subunit 5